MPLRADDSEVIFTYPTQGDPPEWRLRRRQVQEWQVLFPALDIMDECRRALAWVQANHPKTARGMCAFLVNWFNRSVTRGYSRPAREWEPPPSPEPEDWYAECARVHGGACGLSSSRHRTRVLIDAEKRR